MLESNSIALLTQPFYFVRHGETVSNLRQTIAGSLDVALTELGHQQARAAAATLKNTGITAIYSSNLSRARDTADPIACRFALPVTVIPGLAERNWGELEGQPRAARVRGVTPPGAETSQQFSERTAAGLASIPAVGVPLIVAHSGTYRVLCRLIGQNAGVEPVVNCRPMRFTPPAESSGAWCIEML